MARQTAQRMPIPSLSTLLFPDQIRLINLIFQSIDDRN